MIKKNRVTTYLLYAIGEIILVVIGILLALGIDEQATFYKERREETIILQEIRANLDKDLFEINEDINIMDTVNKACDMVSDYLRENDVPSPEFGRWVYRIRVTPHFNSNLSGYKLLTSRGIRLIQKDSLRREISDLFDSDYPYYQRYEDERIAFKLHHMLPIMNAYFNWLSDPKSPYLGEYRISEADYVELKKNGDFMKLVSAIKGENFVVRDRAERIKNNILNLSQFLDQELKHQTFSNE